MAVVLLAALPALAVEPDPAAGEVIADKICALCHGDGGNSSDPTYPRLAGQQKPYIVKQLNDYFALKRANSKMLPYLARFHRSDVPALAAYFAAAQPEAGEVQDAQIAATGKRLFQEGNPASGVPACAACHQANARGDGRYPRLASQHQDYTALQLNYFKNNERSNDKGRVMRNIAQKLTPDEIAALADYLAGLP